MGKGMLTDVKLWLAWLVGRSMSGNEAAEFVRRLVHDKTHYNGPERRRCPRYPLVVPVSVMPLDEQFRPAGSLYRAVTRNISATGVSIISQTRLQADYLSLLLVNSSADYLEVVVRVARTAMIGPMFEFAGPFVAVPERARAKNRGPVALVPRQHSNAKLEPAAVDLSMLPTGEEAVETFESAPQPVAASPV